MCDAAYLYTLKAFKMLLRYLELLFTAALLLSYFSASTLPSHLVWFVLIGFTVMIFGDRKAKHICTCMIIRAYN